MEVVLWTVCGLFAGRFVPDLWSVLRSQLRSLGMTPGVIRWQNGGAERAGQQRIDMARVWYWMHDDDLASCADVFSHFGSCTFLEARLHNLLQIQPIKAAMIASRLVSGATCGAGCGAVSGALIGGAEAKIVGKIGVAPDVAPCTAPPCTAPCTAPDTTTGLLTGTLSNGGCLAL